MYVGEQIVKRLKARGEKQRHLVPVLGIDESAVSRKLKGKTALSVEELNQIAKYLKCEPADLFPPRLADDLAKALNSMPVMDFILFLIKGEVEKYCSEKLGGRG